MYELSTTENDSIYTTSLCPGWEEVSRCGAPVPMSLGAPQAKRGKKPRVYLEPGKQYKMCAFVNMWMTIWTHRGGLSLSIIIWRIGGGAKFPFALGLKNSLGGSGYAHQVFLTSVLIITYVAFSVEFIFLFTFNWLYRFLTDVEIGKCNYESYPCILVRKSMDVNEHQRLSNFTLRHKCKFKNIALITVLHFTATVWSSIMNKTHMIKWVWTDS